MVGRKRIILVKNRGKGQNLGILIKFTFNARKRVTSRRSVSSYRIGKRNSGTNKERNLGNLVRPCNDANSRVGENWILDSGCTFHMTPNWDWFSTYEPMHKGVVSMGNNASCKVASIGTVCIKTLIE